MSEESVFEYFFILRLHGQARRNILVDEISRRNDRRQCRMLRRHLPRQIVFLNLLLCKSLLDKRKLWEPLVSKSICVITCLTGVLSDRLGKICFSECRSRDKCPRLLFTGSPIKNLLGRTLSFQVSLSPHLKTICKRCHFQMDRVNRSMESIIARDEFVGNFSHSQTAPSCRCCQIIEV